MNSWGYIWSGIGCGVVGGFVYGMAASNDDLQAAMAAAGADGGNSGAETVMLLVSVLLFVAAGLLTSIGVIAEGVRVGSRQAASRDSVAPDFAPPSA